MARPDGTRDLAAGDQRQGWRGDRMAPYVLVAAAAAAVGLLLGALAVDALSAPERVDLISHLQRLGSLRWTPQEVAAARNTALGQNLRVLGWVYALGISVAGLPLIPGVLFYRGFVVGFAVAVAAAARAPWTVWAALVAAQLLLVPAWVAAGGLAMRFSWLLWREGGGRRWAAALERFAGYTLGFLALGGAVALASLAQAWTLPWLAALASWLHGSR